MPGDVRALTCTDPARQRLQAMRVGDGNDASTNETDARSQVKRTDKKAPKHERKNQRQRGVNSPGEERKEWERRAVTGTPRTRPWG
eukprot:588123-Rhodomonas_salina.1